MNFLKPDVVLQFQSQCAIVHHPLVAGLCPSRCPCQNDLVSGFQNPLKARLPTSSFACIVVLEIVVKRYRWAN